MHQNITAKNFKCYKFVIKHDIETARDISQNTFYEHITSLKT